MAKRIKTVEYDPGWGWIARNPYTGKEVPEEGFRWNSRESARTAVWDAQHFSPEAKAAAGVAAVVPASHHSFTCYSCAKEWEGTTPEADCPNCGTTNNYCAKNAAGVGVAGAQTFAPHTPMEGSGP